MKFLHLSPLFFVLLLLSFQSDKSTDIVEWNSQTPLRWHDFSGNIDEQSPYDAWTFSGFNYTYTWNYNGDEIVVAADAYAFFDPAQSWVKTGKMTPELLAHEQLHFDISEMHARYFKDRIAGFEFTENVEAEVDSIYEVTFAALLETQLVYDEETEHHKNKEGQLRWHQRVHNELNRFE
ncbi:MAG: DUF922 domain-containing protein [Bacteroidetes bacterium]|nr:DUF922 domain-containing protein [Bacteroidota bacterium]